MSPLDTHLTGPIIPPTNPLDIWTGTGFHGTSNFDQLGTGAPLIGTTYANDASWINFGLLFRNVELHELYAISQALTVGQTSPVPEPSTLGTGLFGAVCGIVFGRSRGRRA
jgi:hypothetical protein